MKRALYDWFGLNDWLFFVINGLGRHLGEGYGKVMLAISSIGSHEMVKYYTVALAVCLMGALLLRRMRGGEATREDVRAVAALIITLIMGYALYGLGVGMMKGFFSMARPFVAYYDVKPFPVYFIGAYPDVSEYYDGFPSGHAATAAFLLAALWRSLPKGYARRAAFAVAALICWTRIAIGMHFPVDVLVGAMIGAGAGFVVRRYVFRMMRVEERL